MDSPEAAPHRIHPYIIRNVQPEGGGDGDFLAIRDDDESRGGVSVCESRLSAIRTDQIHSAIHTYVWYGVHTYIHTNICGDSKTTQLPVHSYYQEEENGWMVLPFTPSTSHDACMHVACLRERGEE